MVHDAGAHVDALHGRLVEVGVALHGGHDLANALDLVDLVIVFAAAIVPVAYALYVFPQRDLAAPA